MTRVNDRSLASRLPRLGERHTQRKKKPYKIVLEHVTQEKKKLQSIISYNANAPPGYTFVPTGAPELTARCKELCRKRGLDVHVVSVAPKNRAHNNPEKIAHHVHRIGHHFPNDIVDLACEWEGYTIHHGQFRKNKDTVDTSRLAKSLQSHSSKETSEQVRLAIRDLFPKIPKKDLDNIIKHAFRNGTSRVGNAAELSLPRRVQLAVVAHIRHEYTNYDKLLKQNTYHEARSRVEPTTLDRLMKWRGENDSGKRELEEMFREIIVIDDSEDEDDGTTSDDQTEERHESVEITSRPLRHQDIRWDEPDNVEWVPHPQSRRHRGTYLIRVPGRMRLPYPPPPTLSTRPRAYEPPPRLIPTRPERVYVSEAAPPPRGVYAAPQSERFIYESPQHPTRPMHPYVDDIPRQLARSRPDDADLIDQSRHQ
ncbi:hypothetical protein P152DRAFT_471969 [Eremomyces bilateralis CBS 781.70]|uniref:DUF2293 domain-containing protein n=1 Tax=Eremomyces bilateralis CBS 781.70 TaxID=1392243 RepID=A0A6G1G827_9PEZI|nr:uncharacterized protein P152DRAFT_471969 [Eremomyces bilateralis CBS 781.70]KAF1814184.1 hypothetical protein P152DRAFT_471969 [Eremomyces bilateralis CBS 781.70]